jgi:hypothetical protein
LHPIFDEYQHSMVSPGKQQGEQVIEKRDDLHCVLDVLRNISRNSEPDLPGKAILY